MAFKWSLSISLEIKDNIIYSFYNIYINFRAFAFRDAKCIYTLAQKKKKTKTKQKYIHIQLCINNHYKNMLKKKLFHSYREWDMGSIVKLVI